MKPITEINTIMATIPTHWRERWCGGEYGACACLGCVQIGNRIAMYEETKGEKFVGDPEYIDELLIPENIYQKHKLSRAEWGAWMKRQGEQNGWKNPNGNILR